MADISICPAIRMPPSFRGVSSVAFGAANLSAAWKTTLPLPAWGPD